MQTTNTYGNGWNWKKITEIKMPRIKERHLKQLIISNNMNELLLTRSLQDSISIKKDIKLMKAEMMDNEKLVVQTLMISFGGWVLSNSVNYLFEENNLKLIKEVGEKIDKVGERVDKVETKVDKVEAKVDQVSNTIENKCHGLFSKIFGWN